MPIEPLLNAPSLPYLIVGGLILIILAFLEGQTLVDLTRVVLIQGIRPNIMFIIKLVMFVSTLVTATLVGVFTNGIILPLILGVIGSTITYQVRDQGLERLQNTQI